jgi:hypothetical protein
MKEIVFWDKFRFLIQTDDWNGHKWNAYLEYGVFSALPLALRRAIDCWELNDLGMELDEFLTRMFGDHLER